MAGSRPTNQDQARLSQDADFETSDPGGRTYNPSFTLEAILELQRNNGVLTESINNLRMSIEAISKKIDTITDIRIEMKEISTKLATLETDSKEHKAKIEKVHHWIIGASAVLAVIVFAAQFSSRLWPAQPQSVTLTLPPNITLPTTSPSLQKTK